MTTTRRPSSTRLRAALPLASLTALALLGATGCSTESRSADPAATTLDTRSPGAALDAAVTATLAAERFTLESSASLVTGTGTIDFTATGRTDRATLVGDLRCEIGYGGDTTTVHALSDGTTAWVSSEGTLATAFPAGATYVAGDASRLSDAYLCRADGLLDLVHVLKAGDQARVGDSPSGADVRRYSFTTTCAAAVEAAGDGGDALATALDLARGSGDTELTVTATVGPDDVVRDLSVDVEAPGQIPAAAHHELRLSDVGEPVAAPAAPAAADVATGPEAERLLVEALG